MSLESGTYHIFSKVDDAPIGRKSAEDKSLLPKPIYKLPKGTEPPGWQVEELPSGSFKLHTGGAPVGTVDGELLAFLVGGETLGSALEWTIQPDERDAEGNSYVVSTFGGLGWVVTDPESQEPSPIAVRPLIVGLSLPPFYPTTEVFVFKKVD